MVQGVKGVGSVAPYRGRVMRGFTLLSFMFSWRTGRCQECKQLFLTYQLIWSHPLWKGGLHLRLRESWRLTKVMWLFCGKIEIGSNSLLLRDSSVCVSLPVLRVSMLL